MTSLGCERIENQRSHHFHLAVDDDRFDGTVVPIVCTGLDRLVGIRNSDNIMPVYNAAHGFVSGGASSACSEDADFLVNEVRTSPALYICVFLRRPA